MSAVGRKENEKGSSFMLIIAVLMLILVIIIITVIMVLMVKVIETIEDLSISHNKFILNSTQKVSSKVLHSWNMIGIARTSLLSTWVSTIYLLHVYFD